MTARSGHLVALFLLALAGCDGHSRVFYLKPPEAAKPRWSVSSVVIPIAGHEDVMGIVSAVARDLGLTRDKDAYNAYTAWSLEHGERPRRTFTIAVKRTDEGYWTVILQDWPVITRSSYSVSAERAIRESLEKAASPGKPR